MARSLVLQWQLQNALLKLSPRTSPLHLFVWQQTGADDLNALAECVFPMEDLQTSRLFQARNLLFGADAERWEDPLKAWLLFSQEHIKVQRTELMYFFFVVCPLMSFVNPLAKMRLITDAAALAG